MCPTALQQGTSALAYVECIREMASPGGSLSTILAAINLPLSCLKDAKSLPPQGVARVCRLADFSCQVWLLRGVCRTSAI